MQLSRDLQSPWLIHAKAVLFIAVGLLSAALLLAELPTFRTAVLITVNIWAFCRFYYYLFYVLDRYLGCEKRFSGILDALRFLASRRPADKFRRSRSRPPFSL